VNRELSCLKNMLRKAVEWEYIADNPAWGVSQQREQLPEFTFLLEEESDRFVDQAPAHLRTLFIVALNTGLRRGELFKLEWRDLDFNTGQGIVSVKAAKNYETRYVPMNEKTRRSLLDHPKRLVDGKVCPLVFNTPKGEPLHDIRTGMGYALERAQIGRHIRFHDLRHTFASDLVMEGVDIRTVAKLLGHKDIRITMRYAHLAPDHLQAAVNVLDERKRKVKKEESENLVSQ
jgi:integrase